MNPVIKASFVLAGLVAVLSVAVALSGLHRSNLMLAQGIFLLLAIAINIGVVFWALRQTAATSSYGQQLLNGASIGALGGILIFAFSVLMLTVLMPDYLEETRAAAMRMVETSGLPPEQIEVQLERLEAATPVNQSVPAFMGTFFTSLLSASIIGVFQRRK